MTKLAKRRALRVSVVAVGAGLSTAGALLVAGAPPAAIWVSAIGAAITGLGTAVNLGEFNAPTGS